MNDDTSGNEKDAAAGYRQSLVIPLYNEVECIPTLLEELRGVLDGMPGPSEVLCIDDGSADGSWEALCAVADGWAGGPHRLRLLRLRRNFGQTAAMQAGFDAAAGEVIVTMDGDLQNDPADIPRLVAMVLDGGIDIASGWRRQRQDRMLTRRLPSLVANRLIGWVTGVHLHDFGCTLKAYRAEVVKQIRMYGDMHRFIPALASWMGIDVQEVEVNHRPRTMGRSKYGLARIPIVLLDLVNLKFLLSYSTRPIRVYGGIAMGLFGLAMASGLATCLMKLLEGEDMTGNPLLYLTIFLGILGVQFVTMGLGAEINIRTYHATSANPIYAIREDRGAGGGSSP